MNENKGTSVKKGCRQKAGNSETSIIQAVTADGSELPVKAVTQVFICVIEYDILSKARL